MLPIIKAFRAEAQVNNLTNIDEFIISWEYISLPAINLGPKTISVPNISSEFILCINTTNNAEYYASIDEVLPSNLIPILWYTDTYLLEYYFIGSESIWAFNKVELQIPKVYNKTQREVELESNVNFRSNGKNYPGKPLTAGQLLPYYPGITAGVETFAEDTPSVADCLTEAFKEELSKLEYVARQSWDTTFGPNTGTEFSASLMGLNRDDYSFINLVPELLKSVVYKVVNSQSAYDTVFLTSVDNFKVTSYNTIVDFKYTTEVTVPADLALKLITKDQRPVTLYNADGLEGQIITAQGLTITLTQERYQPVVELPEVVDPTDFVRGYQYKTQPGQIFPVGYITTSATTGRFPALTRPWLTETIRLFEGKNTESVINFLFKLYKLRLGKSYDLTADLITIGKEDLEPLTLYNHPVLTADFIAGDAVGNENNLVTVWLPFSYKRDGLEWRLAHQICEAFLSNYTIGYHEFVADYSVAGEPVNTVGFLETPLYLDICPVFVAKENFAVSFVSDPVILRPESRSYVSGSAVLQPEAVSYITD